MTDKIAKVNVRLVSVSAFKPQQTQAGDSGDSLVFVSLALNGTKLDSSRRVSAKQTSWADEGEHDHEFVRTGTSRGLC
jgi:hypothetical protein